MIDSLVVEQLVEDVCTTMLGLQVAPCGLAEHDHPHGVYCGHIGVEGDWQLQIYAICDAMFAARVASAMFMVEPDELTEGEIGDAIGELVNILGGNVKGILTGDNQLSLPTVERLEASEVAVFKGKNIDVCFRCEGHSLTIRYSDPVECGIAS